MACANELRGRLRRCASPASTSARSSGIETRPRRDGAVVTMRIDDTRLPLHRDATLKVRPRLFLEGNFFVDLKPGTPGRAGELRDGGDDPAGADRHAGAARPGALRAAPPTRAARPAHRARGARPRRSTAGGCRGVSTRPFAPSSDGAFTGVALVAQAARGLDATTCPSRSARRDASSDALGLAARPAARARSPASPVTVAALAADDRRARGTHPRRWRRRVARGAARRWPTINAALPEARSVRARRAAAAAARAAHARPGDPAASRARPARRARRDAAGLAARRWRPRCATLRARTRPICETLLGEGHAGQPTACATTRCRCSQTTGRRRRPLTTGQPIVAGAASHGMVGLASRGRRTSTATARACATWPGFGEQLVSTGTLPGGLQLFGLAPEPIDGSRPATPAAKPPFVSDVPCHTQERPNLTARTAPAPTSRRAQIRPVNRSKVCRPSAGRPRSEPRPPDPALPPPARGDPRHDARRASRSARTSSSTSGSRSRGRTPTRSGATSPRRRRSRPDRARPSRSREWSSARSRR